MRCAAAAGPTISTNTSSTPTICTHSAVASATITRNSMSCRRSDTPRASASSGCRLAISSGRDIAANAARLGTARASNARIVDSSTASTLPNSSAVAWVANAV